MKCKIITLFFLYLSHAGFAQQNIDISKAITHAESQSQLMLQEIAKARETVNPALIVPRTLTSTGQLKLVTSKDWTSGFFPGVLWFLYDYTKKDQWLTQAKTFTAKLEKEKFDTGTHDLGFKIYNSYGTGYRLTKNPAYRDVIIQAAKTLSTRFNPKTGCIKSWDNTGQWAYPVIIDNMMNLELLFAATRFTGDSSFYNIAVSHANKTLVNHFRTDYSSWHVVDYDTATGQVIKKTTLQGYSNESAWARGQAWGLYGYTMCYRETKNKAYLAQAEKIASFILNEPNLPADMIPYWDFDAPLIPNEPRDASAAAIIASGFYELSTFSQNGKTFREAADKMLANLSTSYIAPTGQKRGFLLLHSTGNKPGNKEIDVPLNYADYYYLEAILRKNHLNLAPVLAPIGNKVITLGQTLTFTATATDANAGQTKTFSLVNPPTGATINASSGLFSWKPTKTGTFTFKIKVTDNGSPALTDEEQISVTVNPSNTYSLIINTIGNGTVTKSPNQATYAGGTSVKLTATPASGYQFKGWSGSVTSTTNPLTVTMTSNRNITATFALISAQKVVSFTLINASTDQPIRNLVPDDVLNLATLPTKNLNIRINTNPSKIGSVVLKLSGAQTRNVTESSLPYALFGDNGGDFISWTPAVGSYSLTATPYTGTGGTGTAGTALTLKFSVINRAPSSRLAGTEIKPAQPAYQLQVYPTPTGTGQIGVRFSEPFTGELTYTLVSLTGTKLKSGTHSSVQPVSEINFDFSQQMRLPGIYYLLVEGKNLNTALKLMRQ